MPDTRIYQVITSARDTFKGRDVEEDKTLDFDTVEAAQDEFARLVRDKLTTEERNDVKWSIRLRWIEGKTACSLAKAEV